jgi:transcription antitermination factor NusG
MQVPALPSDGRGTLLEQPFEAHWYAAYVVARHEKAVAGQLVRRSVESFLPLYHTVHYWKKRRAEVELPVFPSYLFVHIPAAERLRVLEVPGVVHIVSSRGVPVAVSKEEVESLRTALQLRRSEPYPYLAAGRRVRIQTGPLQGLEGVVLRQNSQTRIIVSVDFIQRSASIEVRPEDLQGLPEMSGPIPNGWRSRTYR